MFDDVTVSSFWDKVDKTPGFGPKGDCWAWTGTSRKGDNRAVFHWNGKTRNAARFSLELKMGRPIGFRLLACHTCDNTSCVNPEHLWEGSYKDNVQDARAKKRMVGMNLTHCRKEGHPLSGENLYMRRDGRRVCRECVRQNIFRHRAKAKARRALGKDQS